MNIFRKKNTILTLSIVTSLIFTLCLSFSPVHACDDTSNPNPDDPTCAPYLGINPAPPQTPVDGNNGTPKTNTPVDGNNGTPKTQTTTNGVSLNVTIKNPLGEKLQTIPDFIAAILNFVLIIGVPIVTLAIIYAGFLFVTASGNSEKLKKAKQTIVYTLIGAALLLGSWVIAKAIKGTVDEIQTTNDKLSSQK